MYVDKVTSGAPLKWWAAQWLFVSFREDREDDEVRGPEKDFRDETHLDLKDREGLLDSNQSLLTSVRVFYDLYGIDAELQKQDE